MANGWHRADPAKAAARKKQYNSAAHKRAKQHGQRLIDNGDGHCWRCGRHIPPGTPGSGWHVGHDDHDRTIIRGIECIPCNMTAAAHNSNHTTTPHRRQATRRW